MLFTSFIYDRPLENACQQYSIICVTHSLPSETPVPDFTTLSFRTGRRDCPDSPDTNDQREFPPWSMSGTEMLDYFAKTDGPGFGFTPKEVGAPPPLPKKQLTRRI